jgi:hypothetical protein
MVIFRSSDGKPGYHQAETLQEAVAFVERLRNEDSVTDARVFRMDEVAIEFKVYYRVEVAGDAPMAMAEAPVEQPVTPDAAETAVHADDNGAGDNGAGDNGAGNPGRFGLFSRT